MSDFKRPPRVGTVVRFCPTPASYALYTDRPRNNDLGIVTTVAGPRGPMSHMPGPGGGLIYVNWASRYENPLGVSLHDLCKAKMPEWRFLVIDESGRGYRNLVTAKALTYEDAIEQHFAPERQEWIDEHEDPDFDETDTAEFLDWLQSTYVVRIEEVD